VEWARDGIRVNSVNPWYTRTPLAAPVLDDPERMARFLARTPLGRVATAEDVAGISAFLCLPAARYITGQCIAVDGGFLSYGFRPNE
jgi:Tropinone reductase 1